MTKLIAYPAALFAALILAAPLTAQTAAGNTPAPAARSSELITRTFHLTVASSQAEQNEVLTALRNIESPATRIFMVPSQNAIVVRGPQEDIQLAAQLLKELDQPHPQYRLTYTFTDTDGGKRIGVQRYSMVLAAGQRMQMKEGSRVPVLTGSYTKADQSVEKQTTYLDIGFNFDSVVVPSGPGLQLQARIEQSSMTQDHSGVGPEDPIIRQTKLEGSSYLTEGKPLPLGTLDVLGTTRRLEVEALIEVLR